MLSVTSPPTWTRGSNPVRAGRRTFLSRKSFPDGGVRLQLNGCEIPDDFALVFGPNELAQSGRYKVVWRLGNDVGAKFLGPTT